MGKFKAIPHGKAPMRCRRAVFVRCCIKPALSDSDVEEVPMSENIVLLLDIYGELLPKSQQTALDLRYNSDLSLGEIAEEMGGISRQSVNDFLKKGKGRLAELEAILGNAARFLRISKELECVSSELNEVSESSENYDRAERIKTSVGKIKKALNS